MVVMTTRGRAVVLVVALALAASLLTLAVVLEKPAQAQAQTITDKDRSTFDGFFISCTGEEVFIEGTMHTVAHTTIDANGERHIKFHFNIQGQGEGASSGDKYVFHSVSNSHQNFTEDNANFTFLDTANLIRQGSAAPADDFKVKFLVHVTINANGEVTADVAKFEPECK
jgi:hypothetical protein